MSETPSPKPASEPAPPSPPPEPPKRGGSTPLIVGFVVGLLPWLPATQSSRDALLWLIVVPFAAPIAGVALAIFQKTRSFGLGVLLAAGLGWLILGALCAGMFN
jgi:hypothetical protein